MAITIHYYISSNNSINNVNHCYIMKLDLKFIVLCYWIRYVHIGNIEIIFFLDIQGKLK